MMDIKKPKYKINDIVYLKEDVFELHYNPLVENKWIIKAVSVESNQFLYKLIAVDNTTRQNELIALAKESYIKDKIAVYNAREIGNKATDWSPALEN